MPRRVPWPILTTLPLLALAWLLGASGPSVSAEPDVNALGGVWTAYANGDNVWALARDGDTLWAATFAGGAVAWDVGAMPPIPQPLPPLRGEGGPERST